MKVKKYIKNKLLISFILSLFIAIVGQELYAYQITHRVVPKEELTIPSGRESTFPQLLYRKQVSAYDDTIYDYKYGKYKLYQREHGWVYQEDLNGGTLPTENNYKLDNYVHQNPLSFERIYEYFHEYQNSNYTTEDPGNNSKKRYYLTGTISSVDNSDEKNIGYSLLWNVWGETAWYKGVYNVSAAGKQFPEYIGKNDDIVIMNNNTYRFAVKNDVFISDNYLTEETIEKVYKRFGKSNSNSKELTVYSSSVLRTSSANRKNGEIYYQNMDTAFKFWESTVRGGTSSNLQNSNGVKLTPRDAWVNSPATAGTDWGGSPQPTRSVINYYDNTFVIPKGESKRIYVRHIDVTSFDVDDVSEVNLGNINNNHVMQGISNTHVIEKEKMSKNGNIVFLQYTNPNVIGDWCTYGSQEDVGEYNAHWFNEKYIMYADDRDWAIGNLKYKNDSDYVNSKSSRVTVSSLKEGVEYTTKEQDVLDNYNCIGYVRASGNTLKEALENKINSSKRTSGNGGDWTNVTIVGDSSEEVIVVDFYYKRKPTEVYVRHIDITNSENISDSVSYGSRIQTRGGWAFKLKASDWNKMESTINATTWTNDDINRGKITELNTTTKEFKPKESTYMYQEHYRRQPQTALRIANIKYDHSTAGSYWDKFKASSYWNSLSTSNKSKYESYTCVGAAVGKGKTIDFAEVNKNNIKIENFGATKTGLIYAEAETRDNSAVVKGNDWTSFVVDTDKYNVVVVDFYYVNIPPPIDEYKQVYVRHIDVTGYKYSDINSDVINEAISAGRVLDGEGIAKKLSPSSGNLNRSAINVSDCQELYTPGSGINIRVSKDSDLNYTCIGSNMTMSDTSLDSAKSKMNDKLNHTYGKYEETTNNKKYRDTENNEITLIDFYYRSKHTGTPLEREPKGRLAFYTLNNQTNPSTTVLSGDSSTGGSINNLQASTDDDKEVYDVVPSGETLKMSVDNAYLYMLGAINIKEQKIRDTYTFNYSITQPITVYYNDWSSSCDGPCDGTYGDKKVGYCGATYYVACDCPEDCTTVDGVESCSKPHDNHEKTCTGTWTAVASQAVTTPSVSYTYTYKIPYEYTFYKVKNMRLYTISKIELIDGYNNKGLPLFDGRTYTSEPKDEYKNSFIKADEANVGSKFVGSTNDQSAKSSKTLSRIYMYHNNQNGDVYASTASSNVKTMVGNLFNDLNHSQAAEVSSFKLTEDSSATVPKDENGNSVGSIATSYSYSTSDLINKVDEKDRLKAKLWVQNDNIYFYDGVKGGKKTIVGDSTETETTETTYTVKSSEKEATATVDLVKYTAGKTKSTTSSPYEYTVDENVTSTDRVIVTAQYPKAVRGTKDDATESQYLPSSRLTDYKYFNETQLYIPTNRLNGKRYSFGKIYYNLLKDNDVLNFDATDNNTIVCNKDNRETCHDWNDSRTAVTGSGTTTFIDTEMYNKEGKTNPEKTTLIGPNTLGSIVWEYGGNNNETKNKADIVDVFTPISLKARTVTGASGEKQVDHTMEKENDVSIQIQKNTRFTIAMEPTSANAQYDSPSGLNTDKYLMQYYVKFDDFDVQDIKIYDAMATGGRNYNVSYVAAGEWIGPIYNEYGITKLDGEAKLSAYALADPNEAKSVVNQESNSYTVRAVAYNAPSSLIYDLVRNKLEKTILDDNYYKFVGSTYNRFRGTGDTNKDHSKYYDQDDIEGQSNYIAEYSVATKNLSRVYDFKITDLKDIDWKNIFRKSTTTTTNMHTSKAYYSGVKKWNIYTTKANERLIRDASEIGAAKQQILPLGPYKNTNTTYVKAPKLGYKFSFDLKTTGANANKEIKITPSFYYISKDPDPSDDSRPIIEKNIKLFYKNSSNKYVGISNYKLYFVPDDGYRLTFKGTDAAYRFESSNLSKSTISLGNTTELKLDKNMMQSADNYFVQIWYGEYKLPNSTIAVKTDVNGKNYNINDPLKNGYIAVKFDIEVIEKDKNDNVTRRLNYNQPDRNASGTNITQWDYEGYLGYTGNGEDIGGNIRLPLENVTWKLNQADYEFVKGTVILYDIDAKASSDYD